MAPNLKRFGRDLLVWMVAAAAALQSFARAVEGVIDRRIDLFLLYLAVAISLLMLAASIGSVKKYLEAS